jgi:signal transduction histidine kinase
MNKLTKNRFRGLYWRVTLSYVLVTLVAVLTIEIATTIPQIVSGYQSYSTTTPLETMLMKEDAPRIAPFLTQAATVPTSTLDVQGVQTNVLVPILNEAINYVSSSTSFVAVLDRTGHTLAATSCTWSPPPSSKGSATAGDCHGASQEQVAAFLNPQSVQDSVRAVRLAQVGGPATVERVRYGSSDAISIAVPVAAADSAGKSASVGTGSLGEIVAVFKDPVLYNLPIASESDVSFGGFLSEFVRRLDPAGFYFLLLATAVGTLTGVLISRNLTRRLSRIAQASDAWRVGDLDVRVHDSGNDEVGQLAQDLNSMAGQLQSLLAAREQLAVVEERNRLARDLHDSVKQHIFANALLVRAARKVLGNGQPATGDRRPADERQPATRNPQPATMQQDKEEEGIERAQSYLAQAEELADEAQQELVEMIQALRPASVAGKGLAEVLRDYASDWSQRMGIAADVRIQGERATPLEVEEALYRVAQEALTNVARHSGAQEVSIGLEWPDAGDEVRLTVADNGKGFEVKKAGGKDSAPSKNGGLGLASMRERVEALHGTLEVTGSPSGTTVRACVPLLVDG